MATVSCALQWLWYVNKKRPFGRFFERKSKSYLKEINSYLKEINSYLKEINSYLKENQFLKEINILS